MPRETLYRNLVAQVGVVLEKCLLNGIKVVGKPQERLVTGLNFVFLVVRNEAHGHTRD